MRAIWSMMAAALMSMLSASCANAITIAEAKLLPDTRYVSVAGKVVTCAMPDFFYIEDDSRAAGIRVRRANHAFVPGVRVTVNGYLATNEHSERYLTQC